MQKSKLPIQESCGKSNRLDVVFNKALDVSVNAVGESDLDDCFGELKGQYGSSMNKLFMNMIAKTQSNMAVSVGGIVLNPFINITLYYNDLSLSNAHILPVQHSFKDVCVRRDLDDHLRALESAGTARSSASLKRYVNKLLFPALLPYVFFVLLIIACLI